jgi:hypothetical protein
MSGQSKSCGRCDEIPAEKLAEMKFGKLRVKTPQNVLPGSSKKVGWVCDCGREKMLRVDNVLNGIAKSCGRCNVILANEMEKKKFGSLTIKIPQDVFPGSNKKIEWMCDCGRTMMAPPSAVLSSKYKSCGKCSDSVKTWFIDNKEKLERLKCPIDPNDFIRGGMELLEPFQSRWKTSECVCPVCKNTYRPRFGDIEKGKSLTCGCSTNRVSMGAKQITEFIRLLGLDVENESKIGSMTYDIFIPSRNFAIEYNGLRWHSFSDSKRRDVTKYENAVVNGTNFMMIFEDEWKSKQKIISALIRHRVGASVLKPVRASKCQIVKMDRVDADTFYEAHHYIGPSNSNVNCGISFNGLIVACASFKKPTRQSKWDWELVRMCSDGVHTVHGGWAKVMKFFIQSYDPKSIVTFSDNRLFTGSVYGSLGFTIDGNVKPDYYWVKNGKRHHKSSMRKRKSEIGLGFTESQLRENQGFSKIWDLGKKRWALSL